MLARWKPFKIVIQSFDYVADESEGVEEGMSLWHEVRSAKLRTVLRTSQDSNYVD